MDLREEHAGVDPAAHWYYRSKARAVVDILDGRISRTSSILDVGAGSGFFSAYLLSHTGAATATCVDINYEEDSESVIAGKTLRFTRAIGGSADLVLMMDVLEHVQGDLDLLCQYVKDAGPGASFLLSVPAFQSLWSAHDEFLGHYRRYRLTEVEQLARRAGLEVVSGRYFFAAILPAVVAFRAMRGRRRAERSDLAYSAPSLGPVLERLLAVELSLLRKNRLVGLTALVLAEKPSLEERSVSNGGSANAVLAATGSTP